MKLTGFSLPKKSNVIQRRKKWSNDKNFNSKEELTILTDSILSAIVYNL